MSYCDTRDYLKTKTDIIELFDGADSRVTVCPAWAGRVMTSTSTGEDGEDFGWVNRAHIDWGGSDPRFNNYGGEERMWLSPEGGQFSLWFPSGAEQTLDNWYTPEALNASVFDVIDWSATSVRMGAPMTVKNASATTLNLYVSREVRLLTRRAIAGLFDGCAFLDPALNMVAYETVNRIVNTGEPWTKEGGLVSIWILGQLRAGEQTVIVMPYRDGLVLDRGPAVTSDYFGVIGPERLHVLPRAALLLADGRGRSKIGTPPHRARDVLGSIDLAGGHMTLVQFTMPKDPEDALYMNNRWGGPHEDPYFGDVANAYNDGAGESEGEPSFYELESLSPAKPLGTGESLQHEHRTVHLTGPMELLDNIARATLGVSLDAVREGLQL